MIVLFGLCFWEHERLLLLFVFLLETYWCIHISSLWH